MTENTATVGPDVRQAVEKVVTDALVDFGFEREEIHADVSLTELGVSSLDVAELLQILREEFRVELQGPELGECETLADAINLITARVTAVGDTSAEDA